MSEEKKEIIKKEESIDDTMGNKEEEKPKLKEYSKEEIDAIAKKVETPSDHTPEYFPKHVLSPEFGGTSNYEAGLSKVRDETKVKLESLKNNPESNPQQIRQMEEELKTLDNLYENYHLGMNVFRTAKGGRDKLRE